MEVTKGYGDTYQVTDCKGNVICSFYDLKTAALVKRYLAGEPLEEEETNHAIGAIELYDEEMQRRDAERQQKKEAEKERAKARKAAKQAAQGEGAEQ